MQNGLFAQVSLFLKQHKFNKRWKKVLLFLGVIVVFCTTYMLMLPAITLETETVCGITEHTHSDECYVAPDIIVCDEPVSALDVSIQAQILHILKKLQKEHGITYLFITHDLSVIYYFADEIAVMYLGQMVEKAPAEELFTNPMHPYTRALLSAIPEPRLDSDRKRILLRGEITSPINLPDECRFAKRCDFCSGKCQNGEPKLIEVRPNHFVACHFPLMEEGNV